MHSPPLTILIKMSLTPPPTPPLKAKVRSVISAKRSLPLTLIRGRAGDRVISIKQAV